MLVKNVEYKGFNIAIHTDDDAENPRDWDNVATMVCWHDRYDLGDNGHTNTPEDFLKELAEPHWDRYTNDGPWFDLWDHKEEDEAQVNTTVNKILEEEYVIKPLYLFDHSGLSISTGVFSCPWDSGQVGWVYVDRDTAKKELAKGDWKESAEQCIENEVSTYDDYLRGNVYGYIVEPMEDTEIDYCEDSCWGLIGDWDGYVLSEAKSSIDYFIAEYEKKKEEEGQAYLSQQLIACTV